MFNLPKTCKEIIPEYSQRNKWKELCFNSGGTPSTLQDIKVVPHSGGYAFSEIPNRFVFWRTNYDVLEIIELSLDFNLHNNQIRYKFQNAPILDGITIYERGNTVVILVPTVSSAHRLTFPHPAYERINDFRSTSIFSDVSPDSISNPTTFHLFNTTPYLPHSATSVLADDDDNAMFSLALNNNSVLLIKMQRLTGMASSNYLKMESFGRKRFLSGLTEALLGGKSNEDNTVSLSLERYDKDVFLFALSRNGQLKVWCCTKMVCVYEFDFTASGQALVGAQYYLLRKKMYRSYLTLAIYSSSVEYSQLIVLRPGLKKSTISFDHEPLTFTAPRNVDLIEMTVDCNSFVILCIWRSRENGDTTISALSFLTGKWSFFESYRRGPVYNNYSSCVGLTSREFYLNLIFAPGAFSSSDIKKVLNIHTNNPQPDQSLTKADLRSKVCAALEREIQAEALEYELSDDDYIDISERCWNKFYLNCIQYQETGRIPNGLFWLPSSSLLVVISKSNLSFFRTVDVLEEMLLRPEQCNESQSYKHVLKMLSKISLSEDQISRFDRALKGFHSLKKVSAEIAAEFKLQNKLNLELDAVMKYQDLQSTLRNLSDVLFMPETFEHTGEYGDSFRSELGVQLVSCSISQIVKLRLMTCRNLVLLIQILDSSEIKRDFLSDTLNLCHAYAILNWCCETVVPNNSQLLSLMQLLLLNKPDIVVQPLILDTIWSTLQYLWPLTNSLNLAEYLLINKQHLLLTSFSRMITHKPWKNLLIQNFIEMNEPYKAFDLVKEIVDSPENYLKAIKMFECTDQSDIVIHLAELAVERATKINHPDLTTLYSILFLHHLKLGRYDLAFVNMDKNPDRSRRIDCLRELIITLMNSKHVEKLLNFPYNDLLPHLENIMEQRARSLQSHQAAPYYNFLYALHVRMENFRKAARIMFEQGFRSDNNKLQMLSYSVCLNCLSLVSPEHAWILKPKENTIKENLDDDSDVLEIYQLQDLTKEFELASARSKLLNCPPDVSAFEVVMKLISASRYRLALRISLLFELKLEPALEALAAACTRITEDPDPWSWLVENDISDFIVGDENAVVVAWRLLEALLLKYEQPHLTTLHKAVSSKIMSLNVVLPYWLEVSYKKRNPGELLRLYLSYGVLGEASKLCCELIAAILGKGKENFEMNDALSVTSSVKCLPTNAIDILLVELQNQQMNDLYEEVKNAVDIYLDTTSRITDDRVRYNRDSGLINVR